MKTTKFLYIMLVALLCCGNSCKDKKEYPTEYPITLGVQTIVGKIIVKGNPCPPSDTPCLPGVVFWLETTSDNYVITVNSHRLWADSGKIIVNDVEYFEDDEVEITGQVSIYVDMHSEEYFIIEVETIKKLP